MTSNLRIQLSVGAVVLMAMSALPTTAFAQCSGWNSSLYLDAWYSPSTWEQTVYGQGVDYDAGCCYHEYFMTVVVYTPIETYYENSNETSVTFRSGITIGVTSYIAQFIVGCPCLGVAVGSHYDEGWIEIPEPTVTLDPPEAFSYVNDPPVTITATVWPPNFESAFSWSGAGTTNPGNGFQRVVSTGSLGQYAILGNVGGTPRAQANVVVQPPPSLSGPTSVTRGTSVTYSIQNLPPNPSISAWSYETPSNGTVSRTVNTDSATWSGTVVDNGTVRVNVNGTVLQLGAEVTARSGWAWTAPAPVQRSGGFASDCGMFSVPTTPLRTGNAPVGSSCASADYDPAELVFTSIADQGPNHAFKYLVTPLSATSTAHPTRFDWAISSDVDNLSSDFMMHQTGSFDAQFFPQGCIFRDTLRANARLHEAGEGATAVSQSHYTVFKNQLENVHNLGVIAESRLGAPQQAEAAAKTQAQSLLNTALNLIHAFVQSPANEPPADWNEHPATLVFQGAVNYPNPYNVDCTP